MKKLTALFLSLTLLLGLAACGSENPDTAPSVEDTEQTSNADSNPTPAQPSALEPESSDQERDGGKILIAYFSATNHTESVAQVIADILGGDLFVLVPVEDYTSDDLDYNNASSRVSREHDDPSLQDVELVASTVENWDEYSTVFIGYPIWWHAAAWPVNSFITSNDFTGKTVIPFCTSSSSGLEDSGTKLRDMAGTGDWLEGRRFSGSASQEQIAEWVNGLSLESSAPSQQEGSALEQSAKTCSVASAGEPAMTIRRCNHTKCLMDSGDQLFLNANTPFAQDRFHL